MVRQQITQVLAERARQLPPPGIDPSLILRVRTSGRVPEDVWENADLSVLSVDADNTLVLFSSDGDLTEFRRRLDLYRTAPTMEHRGAPYAAIMANVEEVSSIRPVDRIGPLLRADGIGSPEGFVSDDTYVVDVELWDLGTRPRREAKILQIEEYLTANNGEISDRYVGHSLTLLRVRARGIIIRRLLELEDVAELDLPPRPDTIISELLNIAVPELPQVEPPPHDAPSVGIIDTGLAAAHPLLAPAVGESIGVPDRLGTADSNGHGTKVAGIALYGDVRACAEARLFRPSLRIHSAKVVTDDGRFDDRTLIASQMRRAIGHLHERQGCRVFNISLGDRRLVYNGGKVGAWAAAIDEIARELDVVIVVSAGNFEFGVPPGENFEAHLTSYPHYLLTDPSRIVEPANAAIALTVGSLVHPANVPPHGGPELRPIGQVDCPSPFTRSGPGVNGSVKPDLSEFGGTLMFDGLARRVSNTWPETGLMTFRAEYLQSLFVTAAGTSFAAPKLAFKAGRLLTRFPQASANLIRALLASSAVVPGAATELMSPINDDAATSLCGLGVADELRAATSDDNRVVLYADSNIGLDQCLIYEVPMVAEFVTTRGKRQIQVALAFDPPVRHTRIDYLGIRMSFRLVRGVTLEEVTEHFRRRSAHDGPVPEMADRYHCQLDPGPTTRERGTLQRASLTMSRNPNPEYGDTYFLVVRCERRWAVEAEGPQRFAVVVDMSHSAAIPLYARLQERVRIRVRA